ncbi:MAG: hypothetical protein K6G80_03835 [Treponema sp.]|nr:hypothetical protein [Treponema sp.]
MQFTNRYALLCGSAPEGKIQEKLDEMYDFLSSKAGGSWTEDELMLFPNGITEDVLVSVLSQLVVSGVKQLFLYVCTQMPVAESEKTVWLGGNEIRKELFEKPASLADFVTGQGHGELVPDVQVIYDSDREFVDAGEYYLE